MNTIEVVAICAFSTVVAVALWMIVKLNLSVRGEYRWTRCQTMRVNFHLGN